jgi:amino acid adenylation domain-containing protein
MQGGEIMKSTEAEFVHNNQVLNTAFIEDKNYEGLCSRFDHVIKERLDRISNGRREQLYILLLSVMEIVYYKYTESTEPIANFPFTNPSGQKRILPLRNRISGEMNYKELVKSVSAEFSRYKKDPDLLEESNPVDRNEISLCMLFLDRNMTRKIPTTMELPRIIFEFVDLEEQYSISIYTTKNETEPYRYDKVIQYYMRILNTVLFDASKPMKDIDYMSESEQRQILQTLNAEHRSENDTDLIYKKFEEQVCRTPNRIAVKDATEEITYVKLNEKANRIAHYLKAKGIQEENVVGIAATRDINMIAAILGTIKIGAYYLPIDITYPEERIKYMIENSEAKILFGKEFAYEKEGFTSILADDEEIRNADCSNLDLDLKKTIPFYLIYTSGSTGKPKGVQVRNDSFHNLLQWYNDINELQEEDNFLLMSSPGFDLTQKNLFAPLLIGAKLTLIQKESFEYDRITQLIDKDKVSILNTTPSIFYPLLDFNRTQFDKLQSLKKVYLGGESIHGNKLREWMCSPECNCQIYNTYGPTECTDIATCYELQPDHLQDEIPIGKPIPGVNVYILDKNKKLVPMGIEGELFIGGFGVSNGYIHDPGFTEEGFSEWSLDDVSDRVYATGDVVRCAEDGNLYFSGRRDFQYKIRGLRIDVSEIESSLMELEHVKEAIVVVNKDKKEEKSLVAFVRCEERIDTGMVKEQLKNSLPAYMIPNRIIVLDDFPINAHGKIDRKKLEQMSCETSVEKKILAPKNSMEERIRDIWASIIQGDANEMSTDVNFLDLGGDSIKLIYLLSMINQEFHAQLQIGDMFTYTTVKKLAARLSSNESTDRKEEVNIEEEHADNILKYCYQFNVTMVQMIDWFTKKNQLSTEEFLLGAFLYTICNNRNQPKSTGILIKENRQFACQIDLEQCEEKEDIFRQIRDSLQDISTNRDDFQYEFLFTLDSSNLYVSKDIQIQLSARAETAIDFVFYTNGVNYKEKALQDFVSTYINVIGSLIG